MSDASTARDFAETFPSDGNVSKLFGSNPPHEQPPVTLVFDDQAFVNTSHELCVTGRVEGTRDEVSVVLNYVPDGELHYDRFYFDGKLRLVVGFVPQGARRAVARFFRSNKTLTLR